MEDVAQKIKHADLLYDYIKFHLGLYIATPPVLAVVATGLGVQNSPSFRHGMIALVAIYFLAGIHASWTVASHVNARWTSVADWAEFSAVAHSLRRRILHHYLYWLGLTVGLLGMTGLLP